MNKDQRQQKIIEHYIRAYNNFDIEGMLRDMHEDVQFENIANGEVNHVTRGIREFRDLAESSGKLFKEREQTITGIQFSDNTTEVQIDYTGILASDLPNGPKAGDTIQLKGKSTFIFRDGKVILIRDES